MDGGSAENAGAIFCQYILYIKKARQGDGRKKLEVIKQRIRLT